MAQKSLDRVPSMLSKGALEIAEKEQVELERNQQESMKMEDKMNQNRKSGKSGRITELKVLDRSIDILMYFKVSHRLHAFIVDYNIIFPYKKLQTSVFRAFLAYTNN